MSERRLQFLLQWEQILISVGIVVLALLLAAAWGWSIASGGLIALLVRLLPVAVVGGLVALLLAARPFVALCLQVAVLTTAPLLRVYLPVGSIPLYVGDMLLGLALVGAIWQYRQTGLRPSFRLVNICLVGFTLAILISSMVLATTVGGAIQVVYAVARYVLSTVGLFGAAIWLARTPDQQRLLCGIVLFGAAINATLSIMQNLPGIQVIGAQIPRFLYGARSVPDFRYEMILAGEYQRGFGLYQSATALSGVLAMAVVFCLMAGKTLLKRNLWVYLLAMLLLTGMLATYSRHAILSLALVAIVGFFTLPNIRALLRMTTALAVIGAFALTVGLVDLDYLTSRSEVLLEDESTFARVNGLVAFAEYTIEQPQRVLIGNGIGWSDLRDRGLISTRETNLLTGGFVSNAYPLIAYNIGILGLVSYLTLFGYVLYQSIRHARRLRGNHRADLLLGLAATLLTAAIVHPFDNYFSESTEVRSLFWFLMGLTTSVLVTVVKEAHQS
ncbi:MAG: hypothetical protein HC876_02735 [Chloroflexaceae bacterium]|nr:hypothetical protein [Chloroflexaceae bacterium]